jgi:hypothetical protein
LAVKLTSPGRQRLAQALAHGLRLVLSTNQAAGASFQITVRPANTRRTVVLARTAQNLGPGAHTFMLRLSRATAARLAATGALVLSVRVEVAGAGGATVTRTAKITLTR